LAPSTNSSGTDMSNVQFAPNMALMPDLAAQQLQLQRQQHLADMLRQQAVTPMDPNRMVSGAGPSRAVPISPLEGIAKMLTAYMGGKSQDAIDAKTLDLGQQMNTRLNAMGDQTMPPMAGGSAPQPIAPSAPQDPSSAAMVAALQGAPRALSGGATAQNRGPTNEAAATLDGYTADPNSVPMQAAPQAMPAPPDMAAALRGAVKNARLMGNMDLANKLTEQAWSQYAPTDATKLATAAGADITEANRKALTKSQYMAPINAREGSTLIDALTNKPFFNAPNKEGIQYKFDQGGNASADMVPGFGAALTDYTRAKEKGKNIETLAPPSQSITNPDGTTQPTSIDATLHPAVAPVATPQPGKPNPTVGNQGFPAGTRVPAPTEANPTSRREILQAEFATAKTPEDIAALNREIARLPANEGPQGVGAPFGRQQGAEAAQAELSKKFTDLSAENRTAQTTNSYLQNILAEADKAKVGAFSDKTQFANNLLSYAGISEKATDSVTAKNLLDKYSNQITARLGGGANGSDARSAIIAAAYPNSHMTPAAIREAVGNLVGANDMTKAKATILSPHANARDPVAYQQKEQIFDQNADPRIWQWKAMQDPAQKKAFAAAIIKQDPTFGQRVHALESIGAFQ
jgi:hypothetical protein